jgi:hypothetical protein
MRILRCAFIGSNSAWLPSRRSVLIQIGACVMVRDGQVRSVKLMGLKERYLVAGFFNMMVSQVQKRREGIEMKTCKGMRRGAMKQALRDGWSGAA